MSKILVSADKFDEASRLYGFEKAWQVLTVTGTCDHDWRITTATGENMMGQLTYAYAYEECHHCHQQRRELNLLY